jgi:hypothetical protein
MVLSVFPKADQFWMHFQSMLTVARVDRCFCSVAVFIQPGFRREVVGLAACPPHRSTSRVHAASQARQKRIYILVSVDSGSATPLHAWGLRDRFTRVGTVPALSASKLILARGEPGGWG